VGVSAAEMHATITYRQKIPTIGIGAGAGCSGQVQVITDLLGLTYGFIPKHAKQYEHLSQRMTEAVTSYAAEVADGSFPTPENSSKMDPDILAEVLGAG